MAEDIIKQSGTMSAYKDDRGGATLYSHPIIGVVKNNIDPLRTGKIQVWLDRMNSPDESNPDHWTTVSYMSPFMGYTPNTGSPNDYGDYLGNRNSYGMWFTPPDIGTQVVCIFINGDPNFGYYIGGIPLEGLIHMIPAIGSSTEVIPNDGEAQSYGGAPKLPVTEYNDANPKQDNSSTPQDLPRPIHSYQAAILMNQGLVRDPDRGTISSSALRESPSNVFGISTPGRPIYQGGYDDETIVNALKDSSIPASNFKVIGRTGGHTLVMDDGDVQGRDKLMRLRTAGGHMIMMNDYAGTLFIIHANGSSYIELGKEGTIDMYSTNSVNIRTQGDLNLHADNNININAKKNLNISAENVALESIKSTTQFVGQNFSQLTKGDHTLKVNSRMTFESKGDSMVKSGGTNYLKGGPNVHLNTGESSLGAGDVSQIPIIAHTDTLRDDVKGYAPAPGKLPSIVTRAPAHSPWASACQGVDVKTDLSASANLPAAPSQSVQQVNNASSTAKPTPTTTPLASTVPNPAAASKTLDSQTSGTLVSQMAVNAAAGPAGQILSQGAGIVEAAGQKVAAIGTAGFNPSQLVDAGVLKPGADTVVNKLINTGKDLSQSIPTNLFTGKDGITSVSGLANSVTAQVGVGINLLKSSEQGLKATGLITGNESSTQIGGLVMSAAQSGLGATVDFAKNALSNPMGAATTDLNSTLTNAMGLGQNGALKNSLEALGTKLGNITNPIIGSVDKSIASGNAASALADKTMGTLGGINVADNLKGMAAGAFSKITGAFKALKGKVPQNLTVAKAEAEASSEAGSESTDTNKGKLEVSADVAAQAKANLSLNDTLTKAFGMQEGGSLRTQLEAAGTSIGKATSGIGTQIESAVGGSGIVSTAKGLADQVKQGQVPGVPSIPGIPGGEAAITGIVDKAAGGLSVPGTKDLSSAIKNIAGSTGGLVNGLGSKLGGISDALKNTSLTALASTGLKPADAASLKGAISSLGSPGAVEVKAPTVALDTFDFSGVLNQAKNLLGNSKIPNLNLGNIKIPSQPLSADQVKEYDKTKAELDKLVDDTQWDLRKKYFDVKGLLKEGKSTQAEVDAAEQAYKECLQKIENLRQKLAAIASGSQSA